jgi:lipopolysaccharide export system protein LptA
MAGITKLLNGNRLTCFAKKTFILFLLILTSIAHALAEDKSDQDKAAPMHIDADKWLFDNIKQNSLFTGNVQLTKGSLLIRGDTLKSHQSKDGSQFAQVYAAPDGLVIFSKNQASSNAFISGHAKEINYDGKNNIITLVGRAELKRFIDSKLRDKVTGAVIIYNTQTEHMTVEGKLKTDNGSASNDRGTSDGRVHAMLLPSPSKAPPDQSEEKDPLMLRSTTMITGKFPTAK